MYLNKGDAVGLRANPLVSPWTFSFSLSTWNTIKDIFGIISLFFLSVLFVYFLPQSLSKIFFLGLIIAFWFSKKDYFWFAFFFILAQAPAYFFYDYGATAQYRLPLYKVLPRFSFGPLDFFVILAIIKAMLKGKRVKLRLEKPLIFILLYVILSLFFTVVFDQQKTMLTTLIRGPFYYSVIISFAYLIENKEEAYRFITMITPMIFFMFFTQIYYGLKGIYFVSLFHHGFLPSPGFTGQVLIEGTQQRRPIAEGELLVLFIYIFSLFLLENKGIKIPRKYLYIVIGVSWLSTIVSATRIWFSVFLLILIGYALTTRKKISSFARVFLALFLLLFILVSSGALPLDLLAKGALLRLGQLASIAKGDVHSVPTLEYRYFVRLPRLLEGLKTHIIFGRGFSDGYLKYRDYHVGFFNTILQFGIVGFSLFLYFFIRYFSLLKTTLKNLSSQNPLRGPLKTFGIFFMGILVAHFTTWYFFALSTVINIPFFISIFVGLTELFVREANKEELSLQRAGSTV
jgi:hypothetical protein